MADFGVESHQREEIIDITSDINARIPRNITCGICHVFCPHTTAGLTVNENADPDVKHDLLAKFDTIVPHGEEFYQHAEGNSAAHVKATLTGNMLALPVKNGYLQLGTWQGVYFCEFDGPRFRRVRLFFTEATE